MEPSPYLPSSRRFFNPLYLRVERIPEYADLPPADRARVDRLAADLHTALDEADVIDRDTAWTAKREALRLVHAVRRTAGRELDLQAFRRREGAALRDYATWCVLAELHGLDYRDWPEPLQHVDSPEVAAFVAEHEDEVAFVEWLQWLLDEQLAGGTGQGGLGRHEARHHARPRRRRAPRRRGRLAAPVDVRHRDRRRRSPGRRTTSRARTGRSRRGSRPRSRRRAMRRSGT